MHPRRPAPGRRRRPGWRGAPRSFAIATALLAFTASVGTGGCATEAGVAFQGARHYASGTALLDRGEDERAVAALERAARLVPHASEVRNHLGIAYWRTGRFDAARDAFESALALDCTNEAARANLAALEQRGEAAAGSPQGVDRRRAARAEEDGRDGG